MWKPINLDDKLRHSYQRPETKTLCRGSRRRLPPRATWREAKGAGRARPAFEGAFEVSTSKATGISPDGLATAWRRLSADPAPLPYRDSGLIEQGLQRPGLAGVVAVLHSLQREWLFPKPTLPDHSFATGPADVDQVLVLATAQPQPISAGWSFARLLAPWLIMRACGLAAPGPWVSSTLGMVRSGYAAALTGGEEDWSAWFTPALAQRFARERERLAELTATVTDWGARFTVKRCWASSRRSLRQFVNQPAVTSRLLERQRGFTRRQRRC